MVMELRWFWIDLRWYTVGHAGAGARTIFGSLISPCVTIVAFLGFMIYELNEDWHLSDQAYKDILDYCVGLYLTILVMVGMMI